MACQSCKHFGALQSICRRKPPVAQCVGIQQNGSPQGSPLVVTFWPSVQKSDVCGEFEPDIKLVN
jgi:antitoxin (DNA-binding transcriptional repressor) of toxin-antitoxin stability system